MSAFNTAHPAVALCLAHLNAALPVRINADAFLAGLNDLDEARQDIDAIRTFLDEADTSELAGLALSGAVTFTRLAKRAQALLPEGHHNRIYLDGLAS